MRVIIPVAGRGTRLYPHTHTTPKPLLPVAGKPVLGHILERLARARPDRITLVVNPGTQDDILRYTEEILPGAVDCEIQEQPLGIGHAILSAEPGHEPLLVILGDTIIDAPLEEWIPEGDFIGVKEVEDPRRFGVVELDREERVISAVEKPDKPRTNLAIVGLYFFRNGALLTEALRSLVSRNIKTRGEFQLTDALALMLRGGWRPGARRIDEWFDCGKTDALLESNRRLLHKYPPEKPRLPGVEVIPPVAVSPRATVSGGTLGPYVTIMEGAVLQDSEVSHSIINSGALVADCRLKNSVLGKNARISRFFGAVSVGDHSWVEGQ